MLEDISNDIDNMDFTRLNIPAELRKIPFVEVNEDMLACGVSLSEQSFRQTGRTTRIINYLAEDIRRAENAETPKSFLLIVHKTSMGHDLLHRLGRMLHENAHYVVNFHYNVIKFNHCVVRIRTLDDCKRNPFTRFKTDEIYIDNSCWDLEAMRLINELMRPNE